MARQRPAWVLVVGLGLLVVPACGGSIEDWFSNDVDLQIHVTNSLDGYVRSDGFAQADGGGPIVGDLDILIPGVGFRQFFSFTLAGIPAGATVTVATLQVRQHLAQGSPFSNHGNVVIDHLDYGGSLDGVDYGAPSITPSYRVLSSDMTIGQRTVEVTSAVQADLAAARGHTQFRARFSIMGSDNDGLADLVAFTDGELSHGGEVAGQEPVLFLTYRP